MPDPRRIKKHGIIREIDPCQERNHPYKIYHSQFPHREGHLPFNSGDRQAHREN